MISIAVGFVGGVMVSPMIELVRTVACNAECQAQMLIKNAVFFELRKSISEAKQKKTGPIAIDQSAFSSDTLKRNGISFLVIMEDGAFILGSRSGKIVMIANLTEVTNRSQWQCKFFQVGEEVPPLSRPCSP
jgi:hypothetical protein